MQLCVTRTVGQGLKVEKAAHPTPQKPFDHLQIDLIELTPSEGKKFCLVRVDMFSKWVDKTPDLQTRLSSSGNGTIKDVIPRWGIPTKISSDNGTPFVSAALFQVGEYLGIHLKKHCAYHSASGGGSREGKWDIEK